MNGQEMFQIQQALYKEFKGFFGLSERQAKVIAIALDAACACGALMERSGTGGFKDVPTETLEAALFDKMNRIGALNLGETV